MTQVPQRHVLYGNEFPQEILPINNPSTHIKDSKLEKDTQRRRLPQQEAEEPQPIAIRFHSSMGVNEIRRLHITTIV